MGRQSGKKIGEGILVEAHVRRRGKKTTDGEADSRPDLAAAFCFDCRRGLPDSDSDRNLSGYPEFWSMIESWRYYTVQV